MTRHMTLLYSHYANVGNGYNFLRTMNNIQHTFKYECKTFHVIGILDGSELTISNIKKQRSQKWKLQGDTHNIRTQNQHPKEVPSRFCIVNKKSFIMYTKLTVIIKQVIFHLHISQCDTLLARFPFWSLQKDLVMKKSIIFRIPLLSIGR